MSKLNKNHIFTSESVSEGHPDKVCDLISDNILDACLNQDSEARVACETAVTTNWVSNLGEIRVKNWESINPENLAREVVADIGYNKEEYLFCDQTFKYVNLLHEQSADIAQGVDENQDKEQGAGDQGMMFGYATSETPQYLPSPIAYSHALLKHFAELRKSNKIEYLRPDAKSQISIAYRDGRPEKITSIVLSHQTDDLPLPQIQAALIQECKNFLEPTGLLREDTQYYINPTGKFVIGGPHGDGGLTGRKIIVDTYGGVGSHGGGAFSGKDPSKVDRSAAYYARYAAKNIVAAGLAEKCEIQVSYAIGVSHPISINIDTYRTNKVEESKIEDLLKNREFFDFRPAKLIDELQLKHPKKNGWAYRDTASYGHFGRDNFPWEQTNKVELIKKNI